MTPLPVEASETSQKTLFPAGRLGCRTLHGRLAKWPHTHPPSHKYSKFTSTSKTAIHCGRVILEQRDPINRIDMNSQTIHLPCKIHNSLQLTRPWHSTKPLSRVDLVWHKQALKIRSDKEIWARINHKYSLKKTLIHVNTALSDHLSSWWCKVWRRVTHTQSIWPRSQ